MVSPWFASFFRRSLWLLHVRVQAVVVWLLFLGAFYWGWGYYSQPGLMSDLLRRVIIVFFLAIIPPLLFKALSFFLLLLLDFALVITPSVTVDLKIPVEKVAARLERAFAERNAPHFNIISLVLVGVEHWALSLLRLKARTNMPYNVVSSHPFVVVRALEVKPSEAEIRISKALKAASLPERGVQTRVTILNEDTIEARSLAKVLETTLKVF